MVWIAIHHLLLVVFQNECLVKSYIQGLKMSASHYVKELRSKVGNQVLMIPGVAAVILNESNKLLLQKKADGSWSLPAGMIEPAESPSQAVIREVREETGLKVKVERVLGVFGVEGFGFTYPNGDQVEYTVVLLKCLQTGYFDGQLDDETIELAWFSKTDMPTLALPYPFECLFAENIEPLVS